MIEPVLAGADLAEQIRATPPADDRLAVWWLGQSSYVLRVGSVLLGVDLYLSDHLAQKYAGSEKPHDRLMPAPVAAAQLDGLDVILATHRHSDHLDPGSISALLEAAPQALLVLPLAIADYAADELGVPDDRMVPIRDGEFYEQGGVQIHAIAAAHEQLETDAEGNHCYLSYVVKSDQATLFFAGDTVPYPGQEELVGAYHPQVAFLPINGRGARLQQLGTPGNLTVAEAARLAAGIGAKVVVPNHYDMFAFNTADPAAFREFCQEHYPGLKVRILEPGARWWYPAG